VTLHAVPADDDQRWAEVRGRVPADPAHLPLARDLAQRLIDQRRPWVVLSGIAVLQVGQAIGMPATWRVLMAGGLTMLFVVGAALSVREARRCRRFLDRHTGSDDPVD
jgi:hypothetical protein